jgi:hypothetical protein
VTIFCGQSRSLAGCQSNAAGFGKTHYRGLSRVGWMFTLTAAAYNLIRLPKLVGAVASSCPG